MQILHPCTCQTCIYLVVIVCCEVGNCNFFFCNSVSYQKINKQINLEKIYLTNLCVSKESKSQEIISERIQCINRTSWKHTSLMKVWLQHKHIFTVVQAQFDTCCFFPGGSWHFDFSPRVLTCRGCCDSFVSTFSRGRLLFLFLCLSTLAVKLHLPGINTKTQRWLWETQMTNAMWC